jgi:hypothetical protein
MDDIKPGDLVFLTQAYEQYMYRKKPDLKVSFVNRLAKLEEIIDWDSDKGQKIKQVRLDSGNWKDLPLEDNRYLFSIYYHDLKGRKGKKGVIGRGVPMFSKDPETGADFFEKVPDWIYRDIRKQCERFDVQKVSTTHD